MIKTERSDRNITRVAIETLGCKLNQAESEALSRQFSAAGCRLVDFGEEADIYIVNTCTVTHVADRKSRQMLRQARRQNPAAKIAAIGCYAGQPGRPLDEIEGIDLLVDNTQKSNLVQILLNQGWIERPLAVPDVNTGGRTRSFISAQDGCNNFCTYCIVPLVRGREKSRPPDQVIAEVQRRVDEGCLETVLTGTEIGRYHAQSEDADEHPPVKAGGDLDITGLLRRILSETGIRRLRLSSLQPQEITSELLELWQDPRLCRHFHLSLQSGSDTVLERMRRRYSVEKYAEAVTKLRVLIPEVAITTDVIVGFPGETEAEFQESYDFCRRIGFSRVHVFSYSARRGTPAAAMGGQVPAVLKKQRSNRMLELGRVSLEKYHRRFLGTRQEVLFEQTADGYASGYTDTYIKVYIKNSTDLTNRIKTVYLRELKGEGIVGEPVE